LIAEKLFELTMELAPPGTLTPVERFRNPFTVPGGGEELDTTAVTPALVVLVPAVSLAMAVRVWVPLLVFVVSHENV